MLVGMCLTAEQQQEFWRLEKGDNMELNWRKPKGKLPEYEVLAVGFQNEFNVGMLYSKSDDSAVCDGVVCESDGGTMLYQVRYYIPLKELRKTVPKE
jgi:hypothetical protein